MLSRLILTINALLMLAGIAGAQATPQALPTSATGSAFRAAVDQRFNGTVAVDPKILTQTFSTLGSAAGGRLRFCSDCQKTNPCTSGGTGALAIAEGPSGSYVWNCGAVGSGSLANTLSNGLTGGTTAATARTSLAASGIGSCSANQFVNGVTTTTPTCAMPTPPTGSVAATPTCDGSHLGWLYDVTDCDSCAFGLACVHTTGTTFCREKCNGVNYLALESARCSAVTVLDGSGNGTWTDKCIRAARLPNCRNITADRGWGTNLIDGSITFSGGTAGDSIWCEEY